MTAKKKSNELKNPHTKADLQEMLGHSNAMVRNLQEVNKRQQESIIKMRETLDKWGYLLGRKGDIPNMDPSVVGANAQQVGGYHYKNMAIQPWDYLTANNIPYMEGTIIVYLTRWHNKGGIQDLQKAKHTLEKLIELESSKKLNAERRQQAHQAVEQAFGDGGPNPHYRELKVG